MFLYSHIYIAYISTNIKMLEEFIAQAGVNGYYDFCLSKPHHSTHVTVQN